MLTAALPPSRLRGHAAALAALLAQFGAVEAAPHERMPFAATELTEIAPELRFNGTPMRIRVLQVSRPYTEVLAHSRHWLGSQRVEQDVQGWKVLARKQGDSLITLRLRPDGTSGTTGTLSEAPLSPIRHRPFDEFALPTGTRVASTVLTVDAGRHSHLHTFLNSQSIGANVDHFRSVLHARGYRLMHHTGGGNGLAAGRSLWFSSTGGDALLIVTRLGSDAGQPGTTAITLNLLSGEPGGR